MTDGITETGEQNRGHREQLSPDQRKKLDYVVSQVTRYNDTERQRVYLHCVGVLARVPADAVIEQLADLPERGGVRDALERAGIVIAIASNRNDEFGLDEDNQAEVLRLIEYANAELKTSRNVVVANAVH